MYLALSQKSQNSSTIHTGDIRRVTRSAGISYGVGTIRYIKWLILIDRVQPTFIAGVTPEECDSPRAAQGGERLETIMGQDEELEIMKTSSGAPFPGAAVSSFSVSPPGLAAFAQFRAYDVRHTGDIRRVIRSA